MCFEFQIQCVGPNVHPQAKWHHGVTDSAVIDFEFTTGCRSITVFNADVSIASEIENDPKPMCN